MMEKKAIKIKK